MIKSMGIVGLTLLVVVSSFAGCSKAVMAGRPERSIERSAIIAAVQDKFKIADEISLYYDEPDPEKRRVIRDRVLDWSIVLINEHYGEFIEQFSSGKKAFDSGADIATIGTSLAATLVGSAGTKAILAAISAGVTGSKTSIDKNYFYEQTVKVLIKQMDSSRRAVYADILKGQGMTVRAYSMTAALGDLERYAFAGSFDGALTDIQQVAAEQQQTANKDIGDNRDNIEQVMATQDPARLRLTRSIGAWLQEPETRDGRRRRFDMLAKLINEESEENQTVALWLETASLAELQAVMDRLIIRTYTDEELLKIAEDAIRSINEREKIIEEQAALVAQWTQANGNDAAADVFNTWYDNAPEEEQAQFEATIVIFVEPHLEESEIENLTTDDGLFNTSDWIRQKATPELIGQLFVRFEIPLPSAPDVSPTPSEAAMEAALEWVRANGNDAAADVFSEWYDNEGVRQLLFDKWIRGYVSTRLTDEKLEGFTTIDGFQTEDWIRQEATPEQIGELFASNKIPLPVAPVAEPEEPSLTAVEWVRANGNEAAADVFIEWFGNLPGEAQTQFNSEILEYVGTRLNESDLQSLTDQDGLFLTRDWIVQKATPEQIGDVFARFEIPLPPAPVDEPEDPGDTPTDDGGDGG